MPCSVSTSKRDVVSVASNKNNVSVAVARRDKVTISYITPYAAIVKALGRLCLSGLAGVRIGVNVLPSGKIALSGSATIKQGYAYLTSGKLSLSGLATTSFTQNTSWQLVDTFTGANGTALNGSTCDTGQTRSIQISDGSIQGNRASLPFTWMHYTALTNVPDKLVWDYEGVGVFVDGFFYWDGNVGSAVGYGVRISNGNAQLLRHASVVSWTTGNGTGVGTSGTVTVTLTSDTITAVVNGTTLTYVESGGLLDNTAKIVGLASNGGYADNFYVQ